MKNFKISMIFLASMMLAACGNKSKNGEYEVPEKHETQVRQMPDYYVKDSVNANGGHKYVYEITRSASDSLTKVKDDMGDLYADNVIRLSVMLDGREVFNRAFTKAVFAESIEKEFYKNSILDGIRYLRTEANGGITFSFSVSYPDSDMSVPFDLTVHPDGSYSFVKVELLDVEEGDSAYLHDDGV